MEGVKECKICETSKPLDEYYSYEKNSKTKGKYIYYQPYCKVCASEKSGKNKNKERALEQYRHYYRTRESVREAKRRVTRKRIENGKYREWQQNNKDEIKGYNDKRKSKTHAISDGEWLRCKTYFSNSCAYCGLTIEEHKEKHKQDLHKEHVDYEGTNDLSNCVPACRVCNSSKRTFSLEDWYSVDNEFCKVYSYEKLQKIHRWLNGEYKLFLDKIEN